MEYKVTITMSKDYFSESYDQAIRHGNKWRKVEYGISISFLALGIALHYYSDQHVSYSIIFFAIAAFEFFSPTIKKPFWIKRQLSSKVSGHAVELTLTDNGIYSKGPFSEGTMRWEGMEDIKETPIGIILKPQKGMQIYLPKSIIGDDQANYVLSKRAKK